MSSFVPEVLSAVADALADNDRLKSAGPWNKYQGIKWAMLVRARLSVPRSPSMPDETSWFVVFDTAVKSVTVFPAKADGIKTTFRHQSFNDEAADKSVPWRVGNPCLDRPAAAFGRRVWNEQPSAIDERILWYLERLLMWIDAAATDTLAMPGEPLEVPAGPGQTGFPLIGFAGSDADLEMWTARTKEWGWADLVKIPMAKETYAVTAFRDRGLEIICKPAWGLRINDVNSQTAAIWIALDAMPVATPWELPRTWSALQGLLSSKGIDLGDIVVEAGSERRLRDDGDGTVTLLLGFPMSRKIGEQPSRFHWLATEKLELCGRKKRKNGFRANEFSHRALDRSNACSTSTIFWKRTANWEPREIRSRSGSIGGFGVKRVLVIGAGALGSAVAENLVRMGFTEIAVLDNDKLDVGNLTRHALGMDAVGHMKARALADALNALMPDVKAVCIECSFPPSEADVVARVCSYDVIVDCTGSDMVLDAMSQFNWRSEKLFVSLALTWKAEGLLVYSASEVSFPSIDAKERFADFDIDPAELENAPVEGIGCWHPVFPATAADVGLWSAIGAKSILRMIEKPGRSCEYFRQSLDGTVERFDG